jgi:hypothetical protein
LEEKHAKDFAAQMFNIISVEDSGRDVSTMRQAVLTGYN